jgi:hypothetical protein
MKKNFFQYAALMLLLGTFTLFGIGCQKQVIEESVTIADEPAQAAVMSTTSSASADAVLLAIDDDSFEKDAAPNFFTDMDINDDIKSLGLRTELRYFQNNVGKTIRLFTGEVGDEAWHAITRIPDAWKTAGPTTNGARNYLAAGPGLGTGNDPEILLEKIGGVSPLRANGLKMLIGKTILAVVYTGDVSANYGPQEADLKGDNLGIVAMQVIDVRRRFNASSSSLPVVTVKIMSASEASQASLKLFSNPPRLLSSSIPFNIAPAATVPTPVFVDAQ